MLYSALMRKLPFIVVGLLLITSTLACGAAEESSFASSESAPQAMMAADSSAEMAMGGAVERVVEAEMTEEASMDASSAFASDESGLLPSFDEVQASVASQNRIIVRTVGMGLVVNDVADTVDRVADVAQGLGGWTVSSDRNVIHHGSVSVRVPAQQLDEAVSRIRALGVRVEWESSNSQDVTDEYVDSNSRLRSLRATEEALLGLLERATDVEDALEVQRELSELQAEIESLQGRIKFLQETAAFSLINVEMSLAPRQMNINAGPDQTFSSGQLARFRATFRPPEGIEEFRFTWDFGDGSRVDGQGSAPTTEPGQRVTATVTHVYEDDRDSPYIVQLEITGTGPSGIVEGTDSLIATVTRIPTIEVFAGEDRVVKEGDEVEYSGSFTRGEGLWDIQYRWDFSDGSPTVTGAPEEGATRAVVSHTFENYRPQRYQANFTVTAQSEAGEVKGSDSFMVQVTESQGLVIGNWDLVESAKWAIRVLSAIALAIVNVLIWVVIFSPVWLGIIAIGYGIYRLKRYLDRRQSERNRQLLGTELRTVAPLEPTQETVQEPGQEPGDSETNR
ncbi:MAG: DUF4349 domain-containing protein [Chloroflexi bacterium]|nr:DUF4349 domain-containing protein [Chloroflexota bacterium]